MGHSPSEPAVATAVESEERAPVLIQWLKVIATAVGLLGTIAGGLGALYMNCQKDVRLVEPAATASATSTARSVVSSQGAAPDRGPVPQPKRVPDAAFAPRGHHAYTNWYGDLTVGGSCQGRNQAGQLEQLTAVWNCAQDRKTLINCQNDQVVGVLCPYGCAINPVSGTEDKCLPAAGGPQ